MPRQGVATPRGGVKTRTAFRSSFTAPEGLGETHIFTGRITNIDLVNYTVDFVSQFDQMRILSIQVGSPYVHYNRGEGFTVMPDVGAKAVVCWPGDSSPPFILSFVMPHETITDASSADTPGGTSDRGSTNQTTSDASFAGGRAPAKPGDMWIRGRDGNFIVLHRGGVLQIGSTELAQRIYIPLNNLVMDVAENYQMYNSAGSVRWGIQDGEGETQLPGEFTQTFRVYANEQYADIRLAAGRVHHPVGETDPDGLIDQEFTGLGKTDPIVYEMCLAKNGFNAESNSPVNGAESLVRLRFSFDRVGNAFMRFDGNVGILCKKKLRLRVKDTMEVFADSTFSLVVGESARIQVGGNLEVTSSVITFNGGSQPMARVGDQVSVTLPPTLLMVAPTPVGFAPIPPGLNVTIGVITSGNSTLLG